MEHEGPIRRHCAASLIPRRPRYQPVHPLAATTVRSFIEFYLTAPSQVTNYGRRVNVLLRNAAGQTGGSRREFAGIGLECGRARLLRSLVPSVNTLCSCFPNYRGWFHSTALNVLLRS